MEARAIFLRRPPTDTEGPTPTGVIRDSARTRKHTDRHLERKTQVQTDAVTDAASDAVNTSLEIRSKHPERFRKENTVPDSARPTPPPPSPPTLQAGPVWACFGAPVPFARPVYEGRLQTPSWVFLMPEKPFVLLLSQSPGDVTVWEGRPCPCLWKRG